jgi:signal transduction histidine kinase
MRISFPYRILIIYIIIGALWILFSDKLVFDFTEDISLISRMQNFKGWFFVLISGIILFILVKKEIDKRQKIEEELKAAKLKLEESDQLKTAFIANISHEIRTPLNGILGFSQLLQKGPVEPGKQQQYLSIIHQKGQELMKLISDIIDISRVEAGWLELLEVQFDPAGLINELEEQSKRGIRETRKEELISVKAFPGTKNVKVMADKQRILQMMTYLIDNAIKFTEKGKIEIGYGFVGKNAVQFYVKDTGPGIPAQHREIIFERFRQIDNSATRLHGGAGLGLPIARGLANLMGGELSMVSEPGKGTTFYIYLPVKKVYQPELS